MLIAFFLFYSWWSQTPIPLATLSSVLTSHSVQFISFLGSLFKKLVWETFLQKGQNKWFTFVQVEMCVAINILPKSLKILFSTSLGLPSPASFTASSFFPSSVPKSLWVISSPLESQVFELLQYPTSCFMIYMHPIFQGWIGTAWSLFVGTRENIFGIPSFSLSYIFLPSVGGNGGKMTRFNTCM